MRRHCVKATALVLLLGSAAAVTARAQEARSGARTRRGTVVLRNGEHTDTMHLGERHGRMGINVDMRADPARDSIGARVAGVTTPNSPASRAGVQVGDIITRFNGTPLGVTGRAGDDGQPRLLINGEPLDEEQSRPAMRLINLASRLNVGDTVRLDLRRGTQSLNVSFVAAESDMDELMTRMRTDMMPMGELRMRRPFPGPGEPMARTFVFGGPAADVELVRINPGLGEYFGTQEGLLVVNVGSDTALGLRAGDVILTIGGRRPLSPPQAMRILGTYEQDETVQFEVMRQKRRISVSGKIPHRREHEWRIEPDRFDFDWQGPEFNWQGPELEHLQHMFEQELPHWQQMLPKLRDGMHQILIRTGGET